MYICTHDIMEIKYCMGYVIFIQNTLFLVFFKITSLIIFSYLIFSGILLSITITPNALSFFLSL